MKILHKSRTVIESQWFFWLSIVAGITCGLSFKNFAAELKPFAQMYMNFLQLSVIPVIVITVTTGLANITSHAQGHSKIGRVFLSLFAMLLLSSLLSMLIGIIIAPGVGLGSNPEIAALIASSDYAIGPSLTITEEIVPEVTPNLLNFVLRIVPNNIFESLSNGAILQIIIFSIIFGVTVGYKQARDHVDRVNVLHTFLPVFTTINDAVLYMLPFGVFFLLGSQFAFFQLSTIIILAKLVIALCLSMLLLIIIFVGIIWFYAKRPICFVLRSLGYITIMAISTRSAFACIPRCIESMRQFFDSDTANIVIPFGNTTCRFGSICFYTIGTIFISNIFVTSLSFYGYVSIVLSAILASFAASGAVGILSLSMITVVLDPLGLPLGTVLALFIAIDPIVDVFDTVANVFGNCAATAMSSPKPSKKDLPSDDLFQGSCRFVDSSKKPHAST